MSEIKLMKTMNNMSKNIDRIHTEYKIATTS